MEWGGAPRESRVLETTTHIATFVDATAVNRSPPPTLLDPRNTKQQSVAPSATRPPMTTTSDHCRRSTIAVAYKTTITTLTTQCQSHDVPYHHSKYKYTTLPPNKHKHCNPDVRRHVTASVGIPSTASNADAHTLLKYNN